MIRDAYNWNAEFDDGSGHAGLPVRVLGWQRKSRWRPATAEHLDRGLPQALRLRRSRQARPRRAAGEVQPGHAHRHAARRTRSAHLPSFPADEDNLAFRNLTRAKMVTLATGQQMVTFLKNKGVTLDKLTNAADPRRERRRDPRRAHRTAARRADREHAVVVLHPARGRVEPGQAERCRRSDRRRDVPSGDGGQPDVDRPRPDVAPDPRPGRLDLPDGRPAAVRVRRERSLCSPHSADRPQEGVATRYAVPRMVASRYPRQVRRTPTSRTDRSLRGASASPCDVERGQLPRCEPRGGSSWRARRRGRRIRTSWRMGRGMQGDPVGRAVPRPRVTRSNPSVARVGRTQHSWT